MDYNLYKEIRPLIPEEVPSVIAELLAEEALGAIYKGMGLSPEWEELPSYLSEVRSVEDFKTRLSASIVRAVMAKTCKSVAPLLGTEGLSADKAYTYISNHRDIILDGAFLNVLLYDAGLKFPEIAIGDNLMVAPWVEKLVKLNGSFLVRRSLQGREFLLASKLMSSYMHDAVADGHSLWIAQREGRAKDSDDRTQPALLKMLTLGAKQRGSVAESLSSLNVVPVCCSYEYDPCDYLKAREMQVKRDCPHYCKTKAEDALNMKTGVLGYKGRVSFALGRPLSALLEECDLSGLNTQDETQAIATLIDREIHANYQLYSGNYIALDRLNGNRANAQQYSSEDEARFDAYIDAQLARITPYEGCTPDFDFLRTRLLEMYANLALNKLKA